MGQFNSSSVSTVENIRTNQVGGHDLREEKEIYEQSRPKQPYRGVTFSGKLETSISTEKNISPLLFLHRQSITKAHVFF